MGLLAITATIVIAALLSGPTSATELSEEYLVKRFSGIAGGWYLEQRCRHLTSPQRREFDWHAEQINIALKSRLPDTIRFAIQQEADERAKQIECGENAGNLISGAFDWSRELSFDLTGRSFSPATMRISEARRLAAFYMAQILDDRCRLMLAEARARFDADVAELGRLLDEAVGTAASELVRALAARSPSKQASECGAAERFHLKNAEIEARWAARRDAD